ncbi:MAG: hypothetical protein KGI37_00300 [Alphaproteobacteria bacterium]|nr:hypothetical protein [Alphaproteobacteria bacterium]
MKNKMKFAAVAAMVAALAVTPLSPAKADGWGHGGWGHGGWGHGGWDRGGWGHANYFHGDDDGGRWHGGGLLFGVAAASAAALGMAATIGDIGEPPPARVVYAAPVYAQPVYAQPRVVVYNYPPAYGYSGYYAYSR